MNIATNIIDLNYARAVRRYAENGDAVELWRSLKALGFLHDEIEWHAGHPGKRLRQGFAERQQLPA